VVCTHTHTHTYINRATLDILDISISWGHENMHNIIAMPPCPKTPWLDVGNIINVGADGTDK